MTDQIPRRNRIDQFSPAEKAIFDAAQVVESMPAHPRLTDAVVLLSQAREAVADCVDGFLMSAQGDGDPGTDIPEGTPV